MDLPVLHILVLLFQISQVESHGQPRSVSDLDETVREYPTVKMVFSQLEAARICSFAFPIHQNSIHKPEREG